MVSKLKKSGGKDGADDANSSGILEAVDDMYDKLNKDMKAMKDDILNKTKSTFNNMNAMEDDLSNKISDLDKLCWGLKNEIDTLNE